MKRIRLYLRQLFIEDLSLMTLAGGTLFAVFCWTIGMFYYEVEIFMLPFMLGLTLVALAGPLVLIDYLVKRNGQRQGAAVLGRVKNLVFGIYLGLIFVQFISEWGNEQRHKSGIIVSRELERYKANNGRYPASLSEIKLQLTDLSVPYSWDRFEYRLTDTSYDLDIPASIMDIWHWDQAKSEFIYEDF